MLGRRARVFHLREQLFAAAALGELPLSLLPTEPSQVDAEAKPLFSGYHNVPWLVRSHAVTVVPSASALVTLRRLPSGAPSRDKLIEKEESLSSTLAIWAI